MKQVISYGIPSCGYQDATATIVVRDVDFGWSDALQLLPDGTWVAIDDTPGFDGSMLTVLSATDAIKWVHDHDGVTVEALQLGGFPPEWCLRTAYQPSNPNTVLVTVDETSNVLEGKHCVTTTNATPESAADLTTIMQDVCAALRDVSTLMDQPLTR